MNVYSEETGDQEAARRVSTIMTRGVADVRLPADMLDRAVTGNRKRTARRRLIGSAGTLTAAATAAAVVLTLPSTTPAGRQLTAGPRTQTAAYVLARATQAQANTRTMISKTQAGNGTMYTDVATQQQRYTAGIRASNGQPYFSWADSVKNGTRTELMVVNQGRVYSVQTARASDSPSISADLPLQGQSDPMAAYNTALKQGLVSVVGHEDLGGRDTILLRYKLAKPPCRTNAALCARKENQKSGSPRPDTEVWIDASTYLVTQIRTYGPTAQTTTWTPSITRVSWLPATPGNLALLSIAPPPGYTKIPPTDLVKYLGPVS